MRRFPSPTTHRHLALSPLAVAACSLCLSLGVQAQNTPDDASTLPSVGVTAAAKRQAKASIADDLGNRSGEVSRALESGWGLRPAMS